jgi:hypothetical protein
MIKHEVFISISMMLWLPSSVQLLLLFAYSHEAYVEFYFLHGRDKASLEGFKVLPLRQFGTWGPVMTDEFDPQKDTYVLVSWLLL